MTQEKIMKGLGIKRKRVMQRSWYFPGTFKKVHDLPEIGTEVIVMFNSTTPYPARRDQDEYIPFTFSHATLLTDVTSLG